MFTVFLFTLISIVAFAAAGLFTLGFGGAVVAYCRGEGLESHSHADVAKHLPHVFIMWAIVVSAAVSWFVFLANSAGL